MSHDGVRLIVLCRTLRPLGSRCPACDAPMDTTGCRLLTRSRLSPAERRRTGIAEAIEVLCFGTPTLPRIACTHCLLLAEQRREA